jgi:DNA-binding transcriptional regulator YiaG
MSDNSELKARLARLGPVRDVSRAPLSSDEAVTVVLRRTGKLDQSIPLIRRLFEAGMTLRGAHAAVNRLAESGWAVCAISKAEKLSAVGVELAGMNVELRRRVVEHDMSVDMVALRLRHGLSQREYADALGVDLRTLQNWEQGRNRPDAAVLNLMLIFDRAPCLFEEALSEPVA